MKKVFCLLIIVSVITLQAQDLKPRFTERLTNTEADNAEWYNKISEEQEMENYMLQLVTSKKKDNYDATWVCMQIFDKQNNKFIQELDLSPYDFNAPYKDVIGSGDFNFDGFEDFSLFGGYAAGPNTFSCYFLYDPEKHIFTSSEISGVSLEFWDSEKLIYERNQCCAGSQYSERFFKVVNNRMVMVEEHCYHAKMNNDGALVVDENDELIFDEVDCNDPYFDVKLKSQGLKRNFRLKAFFYDEDMAGGYVIYDGQTARIPMRHTHSEIVENHENEGRPNMVEHFYNEYYQGIITGTYSFTIQGARVYKASYIRKKDNKKFELEVKEE